MFLMLSMLAGLGAVAIPVIVHLLHRQQTTPIRWGAMQFLIESPLRQKRRRNIEHWLLLLARMALLGLLVFALARPLLNSELATPLGGGTSTDFAVVIDHSLSTGRAAGGGKTVFAKSVDITDEIAAQLKSTDTLTVVLAEHSPRPLNDRPLAANSPDLGKLRDTLAHAKPGLTDTGLADAVRAARDVVNRGRGVHKKIIILSDEQKLSWQTDNPAAWKLALADGSGQPDINTSVFNLPITPESGAANLSIISLEIQPSVISPNRPVEIIATISAAGNLPPVPVNLWIDGKPTATQTLHDLTAGGARTLRFDQSFATAGSHTIRVVADVADALEADNTATIAVNVLEKLPVLVIDGQLTAAGSFRASQFLKAAMQPEDESVEALSLIRPKIISLSDAPATNFADYAAVIVNDVPGLPTDVLARLAEFARGGRGVWILLGPRTQPPFVNEALTKSGLFPAELTTITKVDKDPPGIVVKDPTHRVVSLISGAEKDAMAGVLAMQWWALKTIPPDARVILATATGEPLVLDRAIGAAGGRVVLWTTPADGRWNTLPMGGSFVPLVQETLLHLAGPAIGATYGRRLDAGKPIVWTGASSVLTATLTRLTDAAAIPVKLTQAAGRSTARGEETSVPGLYEMRFTPSDIPQPVCYSVGLDPRELDATVLSPEDIAKLKDAGFMQARLTPDQLGAVLAAPGGGSELWPMLAVAVVGFLVLETFMTYRMIRLQVSSPTGK